VVFVWWCLAVALNVLSAVLLMCEVAMLRAANPTARLPWIGAATSTPSSVRLLTFLAVVPMGLASSCVFEALNRQHAYETLWELPFLLVVIVVSIVSQSQHNRRVERGQSAPQPGPLTGH
jgi:hypothetical protein